MQPKPTEFRGVVHGKTIELEHEPGFAEGEIVTITVRPAQDHLTPGEGIRRSAGSWSDDPLGLDRWLEEMQRSRQIDRPELG